MLLGNHIFFLFFISKNVLILYYDTSGYMMERSQKYIKYLYTTTKGSYWRKTLCLAQIMWQLFIFLAYFHHVPRNTLNLFTLNTTRKDSYWWKTLCLQSLQAEGFSPVGIFSCCDQCEKIHTGEKPYACNICKFTELTHFLTCNFFHFWLISIMYPEIPWIFSHWTQQEMQYLQG